MKVRHRHGSVLAVALAFGVASPLLSGSAFAQASQTCSCLAPAAAPGEIVGRLTQINGDVRMTQVGGYTGVKTEEAVYPGARIITGAQSSAFLSVGSSCVLGIPPNAVVKIDTVQGGMCVSLERPQATIAPTASKPSITPILLGGGAVGGAAALIVGLHDSHSVSN